MHRETPPLRDSRVSITKRHFIIDIDDETPIAFGNGDLESIAESFEVLLQRNYAVKVTNIDIKNGDSRG